MYKEIPITEVTEASLKSLTDKTAITDASGSLLGLFIPPDKVLLDPDHPQLTLAEYARRLKEPTRTWAEVRERLLKL